MQRRWTNPRTLYLAALFLLVISALIPSRPLTRAIASLHAPLQVVIAPIAQAGSYVSTTLRPAANARGDQDLDSEEFAELMRDYLAALDRVKGLERAIAALEERPYYGSDPPVIKRHIPRISANTGQGTIKVRVGSRSGVETGAIASAFVPAVGLQLVGEVVRTDPLISTVHVITHEAFHRQLIEGVIIPREGIADERELERLPRCQLKPTGGKLTADQVAVSDIENVEPGYLVLLSDDTWPDAAQMLIIGRVTRVDDTEQPLHKRITVEPVADLTRLGHYVLRLPPPTQLPEDRQ